METIFSTKSRRLVHLACSPLSQNFLPKQLRQIKWYVMANGFLFEFTIGKNVK